MHSKGDNTNTEQTIFERIQNDDYKAFETTFREHYVHLVAFANTILHDIENAENIVQETFVKLWENRKKYKISSLKGYLMVAVRNSCHNEIKRIKNQQKYQLSIAKEDTIQQFNYSDSRVMNKIIQIINQLPEQRKKIFKLNRLDGLKYREIAEKLNISPKTVEIQMGKALKFLRENLVELKKHVYSILF